MKKIICLALAAIMAAALTACGSTDSKNDSTQVPKPTEYNKPVSPENTEAAESTGTAADSGKDKEYEAENKIYPVAESSSEDAPEISTLTLTHNGKTLTYPFTLRDMENIGISFRDYVKDKTVGRRLGMGNIDGETARGEGKMVIAVKNYTGDTASVMDCVVTYISNANIKVAVNSVQPGTTTYEEVLELFGRDKEERKNTLYNENIRNQNEDLDFQLDYSASFDDENEVGDRYVQLTVLMNFDSEAHLLLDSVREVIYQKN